MTTQRLGSHGIEEESGRTVALAVHAHQGTEGGFRAWMPAGLGSVASLAAGIALLYYGRLFLITVSTAVIFTFVLEPLVGLLTHVRVSRPLASLLVCLFAVCAMCMAGLGVYKQGARLAGDLPKYADRIGDLSEAMLTKMENAESAVHATIGRRGLRQPSRKPPERRSTPDPVLPVGVTPGVQKVHIQPERPPILEFIQAHLDSLSESLLMASFVPFLVYFMLSWRDHIRPAFLQLFDGPARLAADNSLDGVASMVRAFVVGNFVLAVILAVASTAFFWAFRLPYPMLIGPLSGILSVLPTVGLPFALAPPLIAALTVFSNPAPYLIIATGVALFHLIALNLLYPKIVGRRVHLNPPMVVVAMMFWSVLWGTAGLILAIPLTAGIKAICDHVKSLERYGRILGD